VAVQERFQSAAVHELDIIGPAEAQDEHKDEDTAGPASGFLDLEVAPVELGLLPGLGLEPDEGVGGKEKGTESVFDGVGGNRAVAPGAPKKLRSLLS
jgi:hypothetical protein